MKGDIIANFIATLIGIAFFIGGIYFLLDGIIFQQNAEEITAKIVDIDVEGDIDNKTYYVYLDYSFNGKNYNNVCMREYDSTMYIGKEITILCNPEQPDDIKTSFGSYFPGIGMMIMGAVFVYFTYPTLRDLLRTCGIRRNITSK